MLPRLLMRYHLLCPKFQFCITSTWDSDVLRWHSASVLEILVVMLWYRISLMCMLACTVYKLPRVNSPCKWNSLILRMYSGLVICIASLQVSYCLQKALLSTMRNSLQRNTDLCRYCLVSSIICCINIHVIMLLLYVEFSLPVIVWLSCAAGASVKDVVLMIM